MTRIESIIRTALQTLAFFALLLWPAARSFADDAFARVSGSRIKAVGRPDRFAVKIVQWEVNGRLQNAVRLDKGVAIAANQSVVFDYASWKGNKTALHASTLDRRLARSVC
jgi:hypothetical protein